jgi:hypothetical protein
MKQNVNIKNFEPKSKMTDENLSLLTPQSLKHKNNASIMNFLPKMKETRQL